MSIRDDFFAAQAKASLWDVAVSIKRGNPLPLDANAVYKTLGVATVNGETTTYTAESLLEYAKTNPVAYPGQVCAVVEETSTTIYYLDQNLDVQPVGVIPTGDNKTIEVTAAGAISLFGAASAAKGTLPMLDSETGKLVWKTLEDIGAGDGDTTYEIGTLEKGEGDNKEVYGFKYRAIQLGVDPTEEDWVEIPFDVYTKSEVDAAIKEVADLVGVPADGDESTDTLYERIAAEVLRATNAESALSNRIGVAKDGETAASGVYAYVDGVVEALVNGIDPEKIDSLNELIAWVEAHPAIVEGLDNRLEKVEGILDGFGGTDEPQNVKEYVDDTFAAKATTLAGYGITDAYTKDEIDTKIGTPGTPAEKDTEGNVTKEAVAGTGVYQHVYSKSEITDLIADITGGESAADVKAELKEYKTTNDARVLNIEKEIWGVDTAGDVNPVTGDSRIDIIEDKLQDIEDGAEVNAIETISVNGENLPIDENRNVNITVPTKLSDLTDDISHVSDVVVKAKQTNGEGTVTYESKLKVTRPAETNVVTLDDSALQDAIKAVNDSAIKAVAVNGAPLAKDGEGQVNITAITGSANGTIAINGKDVAVKGLDTAAYMANTDIIKSVNLSKGTANGSIHAVITNGAGSEVFNADVAVKGLGTAAYHAEGDFKTVQAAVVDPTATAADGSTLSYIDTITQNENGVITPTKKTFDLAAFVKPIEDEIDALEPRVKANEDAIVTINGQIATINGDINQEGSMLKIAHDAARDAALAVETAAMEFMGAIAELPTLTESDKGHFYKAARNISVNAATVTGPLYDGTYSLQGEAPLSGKIYTEILDAEGAPFSEATVTLIFDPLVVDPDNISSYTSHEESFTITPSTLAVDYDWSEVYVGGADPRPNKIEIEYTSYSDEHLNFVCLTNVEPIDLAVIKKGDSVVWNGHVWYVIPSGDDIEDTWRPVNIAGTALTNAESLAIVAGEKISINRNDAGAFVINAIAPDIPLATLHQDGALVSLPGLIKPVANKFEVEAGEVTKISTDLLVNGAEELILYGGNAGTGVTA